MALTLQLIDDETMHSRKARLSLRAAKGERGSGPYVRASFATARHALIHGSTRQGAASLRSVWSTKED